MCELKWTLKECLDCILKVRPVACPNDNFMEQLRILEMQLFGETSGGSVISSKCDPIKETAKQMNEEKMII